MLLRAPARDDAAAVAELLEPRSLAAFGSSAGLLEDLREEWSSEGFDLSRDAVLALDGDGTIVGYAVAHRFGTFATVDARREGEGLGTALLDWCERRQRELGWEQHRTSTPAANIRAKNLLEGRGYRRVRSSVRMALALEDLIPARRPRGHVKLRKLDTQADGAAIHHVDRLAFEAVPGSEEESFAEFSEEHLKARDLDESLSQVAERDSAVVGFALMRRRKEDSAAYVDILAVDPSEHRQGIGRALLEAAFIAAREAGLKEAQLGVYSDNQRAMSLYTSLGMEQRAQLDVYKRPVRASEPPV